MNSLRLLWLVGMTGVLSCDPDANDSNSGAWPTAWPGDSALTVLVVSRPDDWWGCSLRDGTVALRALARGVDSTSSIATVVLVATDQPADTIGVRQILDVERLAFSVGTVHLSHARQQFDLRRLPAIYVIHQGRIVSAWTHSGVPGAIVEIGRSEILTAVRDARGTTNEPSRDAREGTRKDVGGS